MQRAKSLLWVMTAALAVTGCANQNLYSGDVYTAGQAKEVQTVVYGTLVSVRPVKIQAGSDGLLGTLGGAVLGGVLGSAVGSGKGKDLATAAGAVAGAAAGKKAQESMDLVDGAELEIKKDSGDIVVVVQGANTAYQPGARVRMVQSGSKVTVSVVQ
ncbi:glycine zipper 2TM domain-containing protein [Pseudaeromonas sp. ZJS20]|uniref:glycine zipper 2TM domain-containing protein n=1 Tax=Pseudaeromonas aegiceratis TaxID=3153928 RepID=UPI00390C5196